MKPFTVARGLAEKLKFNFPLIVITAVILLNPAVDSIARSDLVPTERPCMDDPFTPQTESMGDKNLRYIDPEVMPGSDRIVFQDALGNLWLSKLNPATGKFVSRTGQDVLLDTSITNIELSRNGPEWGLDESGIAVFYNKQDTQGTIQIWRARNIQGYGFFSRQLTSGNQHSRALRPSFLSGTDQTYLFFLSGMHPNHEMKLAAETSPNAGLPVVDFFIPSGGGRFIAGSNPQQPQLMFVQKNLSTLETQIALMDAVTGQTRLITNDAGDKFEPRLFEAPEYGGETLIAVLIDRQTLGIYRDLGDPDGYWTRIEEMGIPEDETNRALYSMKPVGAAPGQHGINGISYFSLVANQFNSNSNPGDTSLWLLGMGTDPNERLCRKVDQGSIPGQPQTRFEPETYIGNSDLFYFYNISNAADPELGQLRVLKTGITF